MKRTYNLLQPLFISASESAPPIATKSSPLAAIHASMPKASFGFTFLLSLFLTLTAVSPSLAQTPTGQTNWTMTKTFTNETGTTYTTEITYYDELGRPVQTVSVNASGDRTKDVVNHIEYDNMGRANAVSHLPFVSAAGNNGKFISGAATPQLNYYKAKFPGDTDVNFAFSKVEYDTSPLSLPLKSYGAGKSESEHPTAYEYTLNIDKDIRKYILSGSSLVYTSTYAGGTLTVRKSSKTGFTAADQPAESYTYTNASGQVVAKESRSGSERRMTYYVYDELGRQRYIVPPPQNDLIAYGTTWTFEQIRNNGDYCHYTEYDEYGRVTIEYFPGVTDPTYTLYDARGRVAMTQDASSKLLNNGWMFYKYDFYDRPAYSGIFYGGTYAEHKTKLAEQTTHYETFSETSATSTTGTYPIYGYTNVTYPSVSVTYANIYSTTYYDNYKWVTDQNAYKADYGFSAPMNTDVIGLPTGGRTKVLETTVWPTTVTYYDKDYNLIQTIGDIYSTSRERVSNKHNFLGQVTAVRFRQTMENSITQEYYKYFNRDSYGRLSNIQMQVTGPVAGQPLTTIAAYTYDDMGRPATKSIHNGSETTTYRRDLMGRSLGETSSLGASSFSYDLWFDKTPSEVTPRLDGRLSAMTWYDGSATQAGYSYTYNNYGELTKGTFITGANTTSPWSINAKFEEQAAYNRAGNITSITRTNAAAGSSTLTMTYSGYKLSTVKVGTSAASAAFSYDNAGNITKDAATGVSFTYHQGRLPNKIFAGTDQITYIYNADGQKISSTAAGSSTYYHGPMIYTRTGTGAYILSSILFEGGMILHSGGTYTYQYFKTDHTGSTRAVLQATGTNTLKRVQRTDYYPFGLAHEYGNTNLNRYLYSGKELMTDKMASAAAFDYPGKGLLGLYDFGSRFYNPLYGRWLNTDPAWQFANPYLYCGNNPVMYTDPDGEWVHIAIGALIGGVVNVVSNLDNIDGVWEGVTAFAVGAVAGAITAASGGTGASVWGVMGTAAATGAGVGATNSVIAQTGHNFSGMNNVDWGQVGKSAAVSGVASGVSAGVGRWATNASWLNVNGIQSPLFRSAVTSSISGVAGHVAGGTAAGLLEGKNLEDSFRGSFKGIGKSMAWSAGVGAISTIAVSHYQGTNPLNGKIVRPGNGGYKGAIKEMTLEEGATIDRYGNEKGKYVSPEGTGFSERSLPKSYNTPDNYNKYEVIKPIPGVLEGKAAPYWWYGTKGGGTQYQLPNTIEYYINNGYIKK